MSFKSHYGRGSAAANADFLQFLQWQGGNEGGKIPAEQNPNGCGPS